MPGLYRYLFALCFCLLPCAGSAAPSVLQSGEHEGFTRLVASFAETVTWEAERTDSTLVLRLNGHIDGFDASTVFDKITRDRITNLSQTGDTLTLTLGCDCNVAAFAVGRQYVAIDVLSPGVETALPMVEEVSPAPTKDAATGESERPQPAGNDQEIRPQVDTALQRDALSDKELDLISEVQDRLATEIGVAATRGILQQDGNFSLPTLPQLQRETSRLDEHLENGPPLPEELPEAIRNIRISNSTDLPRSGRGMDDGTSITGLTCPKDDEVGIADWGGEGPFHSQVGIARARLFGEFDRLDREAAEDLAKIYIYHGFGAEAHQILMLEPGLAQQNPLLVGIAEILEDGRAANAEYFRSLLTCRTDIALWAILAKQSLDLPGALDPAPAILALNRLPAHLRKFLAPELSRRLLQHGDTEAAALALRSIERLPDPLDPAGRFAQAQVDLDAGNKDEAKAQLKEVIEDNTTQSPEALIALVDTQMRDNQPVSHETASLIEAYAQELRETALGPELRRAHVLALAKSGQFDQAFDAFQALGGEKDDTASASLRAQLLNETAETAEEVVFLEHLFRQTPAQLAGVPPATRMKIAERYFALGFDHAAREIIETLPDQPVNRDRQMLAARIALRLERPAQARSALLGLDSAEADLLRAEAQRMSGALDEARRLYLRAGREQDAVNTAWLADDWDALSAEEPSIFGPVAAVAAQNTAADPTGEGMLARTVEALEESGNARAVLSELLSAPDLQLSGSEATE
ncbi:hypothetical protein FIU94_06005 [Sulfitobacter sp. THAF37]|uniref:tetratricopeptide repeat protein n=1 Tax=Sulfitobacter sp. THAF37 TaxID=2587855 RepID=UPI001267A812|nr:hypothetical protein [Sulfitobacter sp. THAF37]QFT58375.1 hypothetical protein FIU94_06005 [Sulfitobacter sp. THAF37]